MGCSNGKLGGGSPAMRIHDRKLGVGLGITTTRMINSKQLVPVTVNNNKKAHDTHVW